MKITYISEFFPRHGTDDISGGIESRVYFLSKILSIENEVVVITSRRSWTDIRYSIGRVNVICVGIPYKYSRTGAVVGRISYMLESCVAAIRERSDVTEGASFFGWLPAYIASKYTSTRAVLLLADLVDRYSGGVNSILTNVLKAYERFLLYRVHGQIICISNVVKKTLQKNYPGLNQSRVIYCGVDSSEFKNLKVKKMRVNHICYIGRLVWYKNVDHLMKALAMQPRKAEFNLDIIGSGEEINHLRDLSVKLGISKRVIFHGNVSRIKLLTILSRAWAFCLPSHIEGFGISLIEAANANIPLILPNTQVFEEVTMRKGALFYKFGDIGDLSRKIASLAKSRTRYMKLKKELPIIVQKYSWEIIAAQTERFYASLCAH